jgi:hypothetical protein
LMAACISVRPFIEDAFICIGPSPNAFVYGKSAGKPQIQRPAHEDTNGTVGTRNGTGHRDGTNVPIPYRARDPRPRPPSPKNGTICN